MAAPQSLDVDTPTGSLRILTWGPADGPIALCLHGFPDTAWGWRFIAERLAARGWRVVAPFMRGYCPSSTPSDDSYHLGALMADALQVLNSARPDRSGCGDRPRLGRRRRIRARGLARQPIHPSRPHGGSTHRGADQGAGRWASSIIGGGPPRTGVAKLVHVVLSTALAARAFRIVDRPTPVAAMVTRLRRHRRPTTRHRGHRRPGRLARGTRSLPGNGSVLETPESLHRTPPLLGQTAHHSYRVPARSR